MDVILDTAYRQYRAFPLSEYTSLVGEQTVTDISRNPGFATFRAVDEMDKVLDERLGHWILLPSVSPFQGSHSSTISFPGRRLRLPPRHSALG